MSIFVKPLFSNLTFLAEISNDLERSQPLVSRVSDSIILKEAAPFTQTQMHSLCDNLRRILQETTTETAPLLLMLKPGLR